MSVLHPCPDCTGTFGPDRRLVHDESCPHGRAVDEVSDGDRDWFERHPLAGERWRRITPAEVTDLRMQGAIPPGMDLPGWRVCVTRIGPGMRARRFLPPGVAAP